MITPASTLHNWQQELAKFLPDFKTIPYWGSPQVNLLTSLPPSLSLSFSIYLNLSLLSISLSLNLVAERNHLTRNCNIHRGIIVLGAEGFARLLVDPQPTHKGRLLPRSRHLLSDHCHRLQILQQTVVAIHG